MKAYKVVGVQLHSFLTSALDGGLRAVCSSKLNSFTIRKMSAIFILNIFVNNKKCQVQHPSLQNTAHV
jgi:hypothetical protein